MTSKAAFGISAGVLACVAVGLVMFFSGGLSPFRDVRRGEQQFRDLLGALSAEATHEDVRNIARQMRELRFVDSLDRSSVYLKPHLLRRDGWDMFAHLYYGSDTHVFRVDAGYATSSGDPIPGIPRERCLVPEQECETWTRSRGVPSSPR